MIASIAAVIAKTNGMKPSADGITRMTSASAQDAEPLVRSDYCAIIGGIDAMIATTDGIIAIINGMIEAADGLVADGPSAMSE